MTALARTRARPTLSVVRAREEQAGERDWPGDFWHENGYEQRRCCACNCNFVGHIDRMTCKICATCQTDDPHDPMLPTALR